MYVKLILIPGVGGWEGGATLAENYGALKHLVLGIQKVNKNFLKRYFAQSISCVVAGGQSSLPTTLLLARMWWICCSVSTFHWSYPQVFWSSSGYKRGCPQWCQPLSFFLLFESNFWKAAYTLGWPVIIYLSLKVIIQCSLMWDMREWASAIYGNVLGCQGLIYWLLLSNMVWLVCNDGATETWT